MSNSTLQRGASPRSAFDLGAFARRGQALAVRNALLLGLIGLIVWFSTVNSAFLTFENFRTIFQQSAVIMVAAVPTAFLLLSGKIDLSIGSTLALGGVVGALLVTHGTTPLLAMAVGIAAGACVGAINGIGVSLLRLSPIIMTLGMLTAVRGVTLTIAPDPLFELGSTYQALGENTIAGIPILVVIAAVVVLIGMTVLRFKPSGRHVYALGVNEEAAYLSGIRVKRLLFAMYVVSGAAAALGGVMLSARLGSAPSGALGVNFELDVLTAVLLGGVAFEGGRGSIGGVVIGVLFLGILQNGLTIENVPASWALIVKGMALAVAAGLDLVTTRFERAGARTG